MTPESRPRGLAGRPCTWTLPGKHRTVYKDVLQRSCPISRPMCAEHQLSGLDTLLGLEKAHLEPLKAWGQILTRGPLPTL